MRSRNDHRQKGFSLVELLLALGLGLVVVTGIVQLFIGNSQTSALIGGQARLQENARFAFDFLSRAARHAGYFGCSPEPQNIVNGLVGNFNLIPEYDITQFVAGHEGNGDATWTPALTSLPGGVPGNTNDSPAGDIDTAVIAPGTDVLIFRNLQEPGQRLTQTLQPLADPVVTAPGGNPGFGVGDIVMVADCEQAVVGGPGAERMTLEGCTVSRCGTANSLPAVVAVSGLCELRDCEVAESRGPAGLAVQGSQSCDLRDSLFRGCHEEALVLFGPVSGLVRHCRWAGPAPLSTAVG